MRAAGVVAAHSRLGRASEVEGLGELVRVRAGCREHDRMRFVDELELVVAPGRSLGSLVGAVADLHRLPLERLARVAASKTSWIISQSPSCVLLKSLKG